MGLAFRLTLEAQTYIWA